MARSWFYLALWHGTPEELTSVASVEIDLCDMSDVRISTMDRLPADVDRAATFPAQIKSADRVETEINIVSEVMASVDANGN